MSEGLSLYSIEQALLELFDAREDLLTQDPEQNPEHAAELAMVDKMIVEYANQKLPAKTDGIIWYRQMAKATAAAARREADRMALKAARLDANVAALDRMCIGVMEMANVKQLKGTLLSINRQKNGGLAPLVVDGWDKDEEKWTRALDEVPLPVGLMSIRVTMPAALLDRLRLLIPEINELVHARTPEPDGGLIRAALAEGDVPGARLGERGQQVRIR